jgi:tetratricopeptide (TPR) repeat protein
VRWRREMKYLFWRGVMLIVFSFHLGVNAQRNDEELAKGHFESGRAYYNQARYKDAIREFEEAYRLAPLPVLLFNIAQCYERIGDLLKAVEFFKQYLKKSPEAEDRKAVEEKIRSLQERIKQTAINLITTEEKATVYLNGKEIGTTPLKESIKVLPGSHTIQIEKKGFKSLTLQVVVPVGQELTVQGKLIPLPPKIPPSITPPKKKKEIIKTSPLIKKEIRPKKRFWTWVCIGSGATFLTAAIITGGLAISKANKAKQFPKDSEDYDSYASKSKTYGLISDIGWGLTGAAIIGSTLLFLLEGNTPLSKTIASILRSRFIFKF